MKQNGATMRGGQIRKTICAALALCIPVSAAWGQDAAAKKVEPSAVVRAASAAPSNYVTADELTRRKAEQEEISMRQARKAAEEGRYAYIGKTYWIIPKPDAIRRVVFYTDPSIGDENFFPLKTTSFVVVSVAAFPFGGKGARELTYFAKLRFFDGKTGYLKFEDGSATLSADIYRKSQHPVWNPADHEFIYERAPYDLAKEMAASQRKAEKARPAQPPAMYAGGTLHTATLREWRLATENERLETVGNMVGKVLKTKEPGLVWPKARAVQTCIGVVAREPKFVGFGVAETAVGCMKQLGYF
jgi:hypothetical protein